MRLNDVMLRLVTELRWQKFVMFYDSEYGESKGQGRSGSDGRTAGCGRPVPWPWYGRQLPALEQAWKEGKVGVI